MLTELQLTNSKSGQSVMLAVADAGTPGRTYIRSADGLTPPKASIAYSSYARLPGGTYHSSRRDVRNIVLTVGHTPSFSSGKTVGVLRNELEQIAVPGQRVVVRTRSDGIYRYISGYVESVESPIFSKETTSVVSILCVDPFFYTSLIEVTGTTGSWLDVPYAGTAPTGFTMEMLASADTTGTSILVSPSEEKLSLSTDLTAGQRIEIITEVGRKNARRIYSDGSLAVRLLGDVTIDGGWPSLGLGNNRVLVSVSGGSSKYTLKYREYYEAGV